MYYMGIDLHKKYFVSTIMNKEVAALISTEKTNFKADFSVKKHGIIFVLLRSSSKLLSTKFVVPEGS